MPATDDPVDPRAVTLGPSALDGKLIKRPLVLADTFALVGFREDEYAARLG